MDVTTLTSLFDANAVIQYKTPVTLSTTQPGERIISLGEVSSHDNPSDCWLVLYDRVYDLTDFLKKHPGGSDILLEYAGRDATVAFRGSGHTKEANRQLKDYMIGELPMDERIFRKPGGYHLSDIPD